MSANDIQKARVVGCDDRSRVIGKDVEALRRLVATEEKIRLDECSKRFALKIVKELIGVKIKRPTFVDWSNNGNYSLVWEKGNDSVSLQFRADKRFLVQFVVLKGDKQYLGLVNEDALLILLKTPVLYALVT